MKHLCIVLLAIFIVYVVSEDTAGDDDRAVFDNRIPTFQSREPKLAYDNTIDGVPPPQIPCVWEALKDLKGGKSKEDSYPYLTDIPQSNFACEQVYQPGFYADIQLDCQVIRRCDPQGGLSSYLCPIETIFNQITLVCDWWYNVNCSRSVTYQNYSNSRLYHPSWPLLDDCDNSTYENNNQGNNNYQAYQTQSTQKPTIKGYGTTTTQNVYTTKPTTPKYGTKKSTTKGYKTTTTTKMYTTKPTTQKYGSTRGTKKSTTKGYGTTTPEVTTTKPTTENYETTTSQFNVTETTTPEYEGIQQV